MMNINEAIEFLTNEGYIITEGLSFENYLAEFKEEIKVQWGWDNWETKYKEILKKYSQEIKDNWANNDYDPGEMAEWCLEQLEMNEDFTMGVGAPLGADQGIPHSMQGCAVPMMRLGDPAPYGRIQRLPGPPPRHRMRLPVIAYFGGTKYKLVPRRKRKKKKKK